MCRKAAFYTVAVALGLLVLSQTRVGHKMFGLAELAWNKVGISADKAVPLDWEINRIENEVGKLEKDIKKNFDALAQEMVAAEKMKKDVDAVRVVLKDRLQALELMRKDLKSNSEKIVYNDRSFTRSQIENRFAADWKSYTVAEKGLEVKEKLLKQKQDYIEAYKAKIESIRNVRDQLKTEVVRLRTELEEVRVAQNQCKVQVDDSRLAEIKKSLEEVQDRVNVLKKKSELEGRFSNSTVTVPVENKLEANKAIEEFENRFGNDKTNVEDNVQTDDR